MSKCASSFLGDKYTVTVFIRQPQFLHSPEHNAGFTLTTIHLKSVGKASDGVIHVAKTQNIAITVVTTKEVIIVVMGSSFWILSLLSWCEAFSTVRDGMFSFLYVCQKAALTAVGRGVSGFRKLVNDGQVGDVVHLHSNTCKSKGTTLNVEILKYII